VTGPKTTTSLPNLPNKYASSAVIEPLRVVQERAKHGLGLSGSIPVGVIICYDTPLWNWARSLPDLIACDGWLSGSYLVQIGDRRVLITKAAGVGAPTAVMTLEELIALGITRFVSLGAAGGLQPSMSIGEIVVCDRAIRDEGTSHHYLPSAKYAHACPDMTAELLAGIKAAGLTHRTGTSWTTDAPYRETVDELRTYRAEGVMTVEMEAAALFAVGEYRGVSVSSIFSISDILTVEEWDHGFHTEDMAIGMQRIFEIALDTIAGLGPVGEVLEKQEFRIRSGAR
jgi:uridine phosphorylase